MIRFAAAVVALLLVAGCASTSPTANPTTSAPAPSATTEAAAPSTAPPGPVAPVTAPPGKTLAGPESSCTTDRPSPPINLTGTTVSIGTLAGHPGTTATIRFAYTGEIPASGTVLWSLMATNPAGASVQVGYKTLDGQRIAYYYFPMSEGQQHNMFGLADDHTPGELGLFMPQSALDILGPTWWWSSTVNVNGDDIATCGGG